MGQKSKLFFKRFLLVLFGILAIPLSFEVYFRMTLFSPLIEPHPCLPSFIMPQYLFMAEREAGYVLRPFFQSELVHPYGDFRVPVVVNSAGLRDSSLQATVLQRGHSILMLGDSMTFGFGVAVEDAYPAKLEQILRLKYNDNVQVLNAGVPTYSLGQSFAGLKRYHELFNPALVTVCWIPWVVGRELDEWDYLNGYNVSSSQKDKLYVVGNNIFESDLAPGSRLNRADLWTQSHSFFYFFFKYHFARYFRVVSLNFMLDNKLLEKNFSDRAFPEQSRIKAADTISQMNSYCLEHGSKFALILITSTPEVDAQVEKFCAKQDITMISLVRQSQPPDPAYRELFFEHDTHFNEKGQANLARNLAPFVIELLDQPTTVNNTDTNENLKP